ncbi:hypothetical protein ABK046_49345, partial [Streptomyces caeruleatus]
GVAFFLQDSTSMDDVKEVEKVTPVKKTATTPSPVATTTSTLNQTQATTTTMQPSDKISHAIITTNMGVIEVSFSDKTPNTVKN